MNQKARLYSTFHVQSLPLYYDQENENVLYLNFILGVSNFREHNTKLLSEKIVSCGTFGICACFPAKPLDLNSKLTGGLHDVSGLGMPQDATREAKNIGHNIFLDFCKHDLILGKKMMMDGWNKYGWMDAYNICLTVQICFC